MVHVRMRDDDVANILPLRVGQRYGDAARINSHAVVDQIAGETLVGSRLAVAIKAAG